MVGSHGHSIVGRLYYRGRAARYRAPIRKRGFLVKTTKLDLPPSWTVGDQLDKGGYGLTMPERPENTWCSR